MPITRELTDDRGRRWRCQLHPLLSGMLLAECMRPSEGVAAFSLVLGARTDWLTMPLADLIKAIYEAEANQG